LERALVTEGAELHLRARVLPRQAGHHLPGAALGATGLSHCPEVRACPSWGNACTRKQPPATLLAIVSARAVDGPPNQRAPPAHASTPMTEGRDVPHRHRGRSRLLPG